MLTLKILWISEHLGFWIFILGMFYISVKIFPRFSTIVVESTSQNVCRFSSWRDNISIVSHKILFLLFTSMYRSAIDKFTSQSYWVLESPSYAWPQVRLTLIFWARHGLNYCPDMQKTPGKQEWGCCSAHQLPVQEHLGCA
jgi:hypothetical protein